MSIQDNQFMRRVLQMEEESGTRKILLVDDTPSTVSMVRTALESGGYEVFVATSGEKALRRAQLAEPDLILLDILMPGMDGYETCRQLKSQEKTSDIPVIFMSALTGKFDKVKGFDAGGVDYVTKPIETEELLSRVNTHLTIRRLQAGLIEAKTGLEEKVLARTEELRKSNSRLQEEISERKKAEEALRESEERYRVMVETSNEGIWAIDADGKTTFANRQMAEMLGTTVADMMGSSLFEFMAEEDVPPAQYLLKHRSEALEERHDFKFRRRDGSELWAMVSAVPTFDRDGVFSGAFAMITDITDRKRAEENLRKFKTLTDRANYGCAMSDLQGHLIYVNDSFAQMHGYSPAELIGKNLSIFHMEQQMEEVNRLNEKLKREGGYDTEEVWHVKTDGTVFPTLMTGTEIKDDDGTPLFMSATAIDITERKRAEEELRKAHDELEHRVKERTAELRESNECLINEIADREKAELALRESEVRYRLVVENAKEAIYVVQGDRIRFANRFVLEQTGYSEEELFSTPYTEFVFSDDREMVRQNYLRRLRGEDAPSRYSLRTLGKHGDIMWVEVDPVLVTWEGQPAVLAFATDITQRKKAEEALKESEERFRTIFESVQDCIFVKDGTFKYTHVNPALCNLFGFPAAQILGRRAGDFFDKETAKQISRRDSRVLAGESIEWEQTRSISGVPVTLHESVVPLRNSKGEIVGVCGIAHNVTERSNLLREVQRVAEDYPSEAMRATFKKARVAANSESIVLLQGESGSGKDFLAQWIHDHSHRANGPYFFLNCAAVSKELAESELFGHERGAFTGAVRQKRGLLELAEGGTILLNEIGELDLSLQSKLLTFLDTKEFLRVGGQQPVQVSARLIAASHRDLSSEVAKGRFLEPLFYRLSVFPIHVPPLRERIEDLPILAEEIMSRLAPEMQLDETPVIDSSHIRLLARYSWPGNVRELRNVIERSLMLWKGGKFNLDLSGAKPDEKDLGGTVCLHPAQTLEDATSEVTRSLSREALRRTGGNKKEAARILGVSREKLYRLIKKFGIENETST